MRVSPKDTMKRKQFIKGTEQIAQEGAIQIFKLPGAGLEEVIVGVVGTLQFDVFQYRMKSEYGVELYMDGTALRAPAASSPPAPASRRIWCCAPAPPCWRTSRAACWWPSAGSGPWAFSPSTTPAWSWPSPCLSEPETVRRKEADGFCFSFFRLSPFRRKPHPNK